MKQNNSPNQLKLEEQIKVKFAGRDGAEFVFSIGPQRGRFLVTRVGRQAFSAMILGSQEALTEYQEKFLSSFKIKPRVPSN